MRSAADLKHEIERRLKGYLKRDTSGIRHELLSLFIKSRSVTIPEAFEQLKTKFTVSLQSVASMIGTVASRIGILSVQKINDNSTSVYTLRDKYTDMVSTLILAV
ncbi:DUF2551 domain-containing protein [Methanogenium sp. MK-MG]|uniref:DUF2551 domain-containing protein n=1 Tax=Methanogenium sp. MK-MG TaxID=2599926 RepID=UPI0013EE3A76|nr:DUF2551 domain-containing protein [Methanogenium sp. MK-MG]KAF1076942.1 hypothetical protein MKMG_01367 [Methanogenium sp. MK-MG]